MFLLDQIHSSIFTTTQLLYLYEVINTYLFLGFWKVLERMELGVCLICGLNDHASLHIAVNSIEKGRSLSRYFFLFILIFLHLLMFHEAGFLTNLNHRFFSPHLVQMTWQVLNGLAHSILPLRYILKEFPLWRKRVLRRPLFFRIINDHTPGHFTTIGVSSAGLGCDIGKGRTIGLIVEVASLERKALVVGGRIRIRVIICFGKVGLEG